MARWRSVAVVDRRAGEPAAFHLLSLIVEPNRMPKNIDSSVWTCAMRDGLLFAALFIACCGCRPYPVPPSGLLDGTYPATDSFEANPLFVPVTDREFVWNQVVDEIDNYFKIRREHRVRMVGHVLMEGTIDTFPTIGSTLFEPWRRDSVSGFERTYATLQSIRRRAHVRVVPSSGGFMIEVAVFKELEDMIQPQNASVGDSTFRYDTTPERTDEEGLRLPPGTLGWISLGRDHGLEQRILSNLRGRLATDAAAQSAPGVVH